MCLTIDPMDNHITQLEHVLSFQTKQQKNKNERVHQCQAKNSCHSFYFMPSLDRIGPLFEALEYM